MEYISHEVIAALVSGIALLVLAVLATIRGQFKAIRSEAEYASSFSKALREHNDTNIALSNQLQSALERQQEYYERWRTDRDTWDAERIKLLARINTIEADNTKRIDDLTREYVHIQAQLKSEKAARESKEREHSLRLNQLHGRIAELEHERNELRKERDTLKTERDTLSARVDALAAEVDTLKKRGTGPLGDAPCEGEDTPPDTDESSAGAGERADASEQEQ